MICCLFFQAEDGIRGLVRSRGLGDVYKRQRQHLGTLLQVAALFLERDWLQPASQLYERAAAEALSLIHI